jgi:5-dehydro-4-deoxyglucarate dehydratase
MHCSEVIKRLSCGLISFPVTHFDAKGEFDSARYREHCSWLVQHDISGLFAAGGTGEFFSLTPKEVAAVVAAAVQEVRGRVPVIAGCGYGTAMAVELARAAERAGADGLLLFPPYLVTGEPQGMIAHIEAVCRSVSIGVITYNRDNGVLGAAELEQLVERCPNLIGFKDGVGDIELMTDIRARLGDRLIYMCGLPTAETFALPYMDMGVTTYSSAIFNFLPDWALHFYRLARAREREAVMRELKDFVVPYLAIRDRGKGYAVSIIKAGLDLIGRPAGSVRAPLTDLRPEEKAELKVLIEAQQLRMATRQVAANVRPFGT